MSAIHYQAVSANNRLCWRDDDTRILLEAWKNNLHIIRNLKKSSNRHPLYYAISKELQKHGFHRSTKEVHNKMSNLKRMYRAAKFENKEEHFHYSKEVAEILKIQEEILAEQTAREFNTLQNGSILHEPCSEGTENTSGNSNNVQVIRLSVPEEHQEIPEEHQEVPELNLPYTAINHAENEAPNDPEVIHIITLPQSSTGDYQKTSRNILNDFLVEFERSNKQLEQNDAAMLQLFKEQNDIFRTQTTLLMKLLLK